MRRLVVAAVVVALVGLVSSARATENPTGTWKWETNFGGKARENTLKLKLDGDKLTGSILGGDNQEIAIENATFQLDRGWRGAFWRRFFFNFLKWEGVNPVVFLNWFDK